MDSEPADAQSDVEDDSMDESNKAEDQETDEEEDHDMYVWLKQTKAFLCRKTNLAFYFLIVWPLLVMKTQVGPKHQVRKSALISLRRTAKKRTLETI